MNILLIIYMIVLAVAIITALRHLLLIWQAIRQKDVLCEETTGRYESLGFIGFSVICSNIKNIYHIEQLLSVEYDRYEVIIVLDSQMAENHFTDILNHYQMIKVSCCDSDELPLARIRNLFRSRSRNFRRLILIDRQYMSTYEDFDAAASVASYSYLLPIRDGYQLHTHAIEPLAIILSKTENRIFDLVISHTDTDCYIFRRQAVIDYGGFSKHLIWEIGSRATLSIYLPICYKQKNLQNLNFRTKATISLAIIALLISVRAMWGILPLVATATTITVLFLATLLASQLCNGTSWSLYNIFCFFRQMCPIFRPRKFIV